MPVEKTLKEIKELLEYQGKTFAAGYSEFNKRFVKKEEIKVLNEHLKNIREGIDGIKEHLRLLNGQVARNTSFRNKITGGMILLAFIGAGNFITLFIFIIINI